MGYDIRLLALDLDGTTFNSDKIITERTRQAIAAAIRKGVIVVPSTGRTKRGLPESFISIPGVRYALTSNGAAVWDLYTNKLIHGDFIDNVTARSVVDLLLSVDAMVDVYHNGDCYSDQTGYDKVLHTYTHIPTWFKLYTRTSKTPVNDLRDRVYSGRLNIEKFAIFFDDMDLRRKIFEQAHAIDGLSIVFGNPFNVEITSTTATKGDALMRFAMKMGIRPDQVMACGDTMNDKTLLQKAGLAVAMDNADEDIRKLADFVTLSNDEDGVAAAIEKFIL